MDEPDYFELRWAIHHSEVCGGIGRINRLYDSVSVIACPRAYVVGDHLYYNEAPI
jgi:hypothetical protein